MINSIQNFISSYSLLIHLIFDSLLILFLISFLNRKFLYMWSKLNKLAVLEYKRYKDVLSRLDTKDKSLDQVRKKVLNQINNQLKQ